MVFLPEKMKIEKIERVVTNIHDKIEYVIHIRNLQQDWIMDWFWKAFIEWLNWIKMLWWNHILTWILSLDKKENNNFEKEFFKFINNAVLGKTMTNVRKYKNIILATREIRRNYLVSELNYHTTKLFTENN